MKRRQFMTGAASGAVVACQDGLDVEGDTPAAGMDPVDDIRWDVASPDSADELLHTIRAEEEE